MLFSGGTSSSKNGSSGSRSAASNSKSQSSSSKNRSNPEATTKVDFYLWCLLLCCFNVQTLLYLFNWIWLQCKVVCVKFEVDDVDEAYLKQLLGQFGAIVKIIMLPRMVWHFIFNIYNLFNKYIHLIFKWLLILFSCNIFLGFCEYGNLRPGRGYSKIFLPKPFEDQRRTGRIYSVCSIQFPTGE